MSFIFPIISSISIAITCGYMLYKYFIENNDPRTPDDKTPDDKTLCVIDKDETRPVLKIPIVDTFNKKEYTSIPSDDIDIDEFDIIYSDDVEL